MPGTALLGLQWGDEGKGKLIDHLAAKADVVVRFQGGGNAGHTVVVGDTKYILHHLPSGILHADKLCVVGPGVVVDPVTLEQELEEVAREGIETAGRLILDYRAHLVVPHHRFQDQTAEARRGEGKIGTTGRGIGPAYTDKMCRIGIRMEDLLDEAALREKVALFVEEKRRLFGADWLPEHEAPVLTDFCRTHAERLAPMIRDGVERVNGALDEGREVLFEGAQGTLLDIDLGSYPFATSSNTTIGGVFHGAGVSPRRLDRVVGVTKAYMTRVGAGAFPSELHGEAAEALRGRGGEFGATTGRPRRCGWLDAVAGAYAVKVNGVDKLAVTKLDVLSGLDRIAVCTAYERDGERVSWFDSRHSVLNRVRPVFEEHAGWSEDLGGARSLSDLPVNCRRYLERVEALLGAPIGFVSVGPERDQVIEVR